MEFTVGQEIHGCIITEVRPESQELVLFNGRTAAWQTISMADAREE